MLLSLPISIVSFSTTSRKNSFLEYLMPYCLQDTTLDICLAESIELAIVDFFSNGLDSSYDSDLMKPLSNFI